jgi:pimeloyl-ACP methyl ester carboxylesterase
VLTSILAGAGLGDARRVAQRIVARMSHAVGEPVTSSDPLVSMRRLHAQKKPVLLVHGLADKLIPYRASLELKHANPDAELVLVPDMGHGREVPADDPAYRAELMSFVHRVVAQSTEASCMEALQTA